MKKLSGYLIGITLIIGLLSCAGWLFNVEFLIHPFGQSLVMAPVTAVSIVMGSLSFFLLCKIAPLPPGPLKGEAQGFSPPPRRGRGGALLAGRLLAIGVLSVGLLKLLTLTGLHIGPDRWPYSDKYISATTTVTGSLVLITINSALGFIITGSALLLIGLKGRWPLRLVNALAIWGFLVGVFAFIGFIYHVKEFYGILPYMSVAPSTALCFLLFGLGILFENSDQGFMTVFSSPYLGGDIARILIPIGVLAPFVLGYFALLLGTKISFSAELGLATINALRMFVLLIVIWILAQALNNSDEKRQKAETLLERRAQLFNVMPDAVLDGNKDFTITNLNPVAKRLFKVSEEEMGHIKLDDLFIAGPGGAFKEIILQDVLGEKGFWRAESDFTTRTGQKINALAMFKAVTDAAGEKVGWLAVFTDISPLRLNEELKVANDYLEQLAFISAHDIKSPILTLKGLNDMVNKSATIQPADLQILEMQGKVIDEMQLTNNALNEILRLRKNLMVKESGANGAGRDMALGTLTDNLKSILQSEIRLSGATLEMNTDGISGLRFPQIYFQSLFYNLLSNAIKYRSPQRPLVIKFTGKQTAPDEVKFTIADNGLGFDMEQNKNKLFGIFKRFHAHVDGTGIGLHIVKSIVDAFGGHIEVESQPDIGTRFELTFKIPVQS